MDSRVAGAVDDADSGIEQLVMAEIESPAEIGDQNEEERRHVRGAPARGGRRSAAVARRHAREHVVRRHEGERHQREHQQASLQYFIEGKMKDIEADVDAIERIEHAKGLAIAEAQVGVPLREHGNSEQRGHCRADEYEAEPPQFRERGDPRLEIHLVKRSPGPPPRPRRALEHRDVPRRSAQVEPEESEGEDERRKPHRALDG